MGRWGLLRLHALRGNPRRISPPDHRQGLLGAEDLGPGLDEEPLAEEPAPGHGGPAPVVGQVVINQAAHESTRDSLEELSFQMRRLQRGGGRRR
jgi:hypothetical protein